MLVLRLSLVRTALLAALSAALISTAGASMLYNGNGNGGFGGAIGQGSLFLADDGVNLTFTVTRGPGLFSDYLVVYFDTQSGGATSLFTSGDIGSPFGGRRAVVNEFGSGISSFSAGFGSDFAFALKPNYLGSQDPSNHLFTTPSGANANTLGFVNTYAVTNFTANNAATYSWTIPFADLGVVPGQSFTFLTTYLNPFDGGGSDATFRSNEMFGLENPGANPGFANYSFTTALVYQTAAIPEPSSVIAGALALCGCGWMGWRRRIRKI